MKALDAVAPYDWASFLQRWIDGREEVVASAGLERQGWQRVYTDISTATYRQNEAELRVADLSYSTG